MATFPSSIPKPKGMSYAVNSNCRKIETMGGFRIIPDKRTPKVGINLTYFLTMQQKNDLLSFYEATRRGADYFDIELPIDEGYATFPARFVAPLTYSYESVSTNVTLMLETFFMPYLSIAEVDSALGLLQFVKIL